MISTTTKRTASLPLADFYDRVLQNDALASAYLQDALAAFNETEEWPALQLVLQNLTRAKGITTIAEQMGISRQSLSNMLNGDSVPSATRFLKLLHALGYRLEVKAVGGELSDD